MAALVFLLLDVIRDQRLLWQLFFQCAFFDKKVVYKKAVLHCSKSWESSILYFWELRKFISSYILNASPSSFWFQSYIFPVLIFSSTVYLLFLIWVITFQVYLQLFEFKFIAYMHNIKTRKMFPKIVLRTFWYWNHVKAKKVSIIGQKTLSYRKKTYSFKNHFYALDIKCNSLPLCKGMQIRIG